MVKMVEVLSLFLMLAILVQNKHTKAISNQKFNMLNGGRKVHSTVAYCLFICQLTDMLYTQTRALAYADFRVYRLMIHRCIRTFYLLF